MPEVRVEMPEVRVEMPEVRVDGPVQVMTAHAVQGRSPKGRQWTHVSKLVFLSLIIAIVVIPTRLSKGAFSARRVVRAYLLAAVAYGFALLYVIPRVGL